MAQITIAGENLIASTIANNQNLVIDKVIFANVPGLDHTQPVNRLEGLPNQSHIVKEMPVTKAGVVNSNTVVYSAVLGSDIGTFDMNWMGLWSSAHNALVAISYFDVQTKRKTVGDVLGDVINKNFAIEFNAAPEVTGINIEAESWQIDYTARLEAMDKIQNLSIEAMYGREAFQSKSFKVKFEDNKYYLTLGRGFFGGLYFNVSEDIEFDPGSLPTYVYLDVYQLKTMSGISNKYKIKSTSLSALDDYDDDDGKHRYIRLGKINNSASIEDLRANIRRRLSVNESDDEIVKTLNPDSENGHRWITIARIPADIASHYERASARFVLAEERASSHQSIHFYAGIMYGKNPVFTVLSNSSYSGKGAFSKLRIAYSNTYDNVELQAYYYGMDDRTCRVRLGVYENEVEGGWELVELEDASDDSNFSRFEEIDLDLTTSINTNDEIYIKGAQVLHTGNQPRVTDQEKKDLKSSITKRFSPDDIGDILAFYGIGRGARPAQDLDSDIPTDFNKVTYNANSITVAGDWENHPLKGIGDITATGQLSVKRRLYDAGCAIVQTLYLWRRKFERMGSGDLDGNPDSVVWTKWQERSDIIPFQGDSDSSDECFYWQSPKGGKKGSRESVETGAIKIELPADYTSNTEGNNMISMWVDVFCYETYKSCSFFINGYARSTGNGTNWSNVSAVQLGGETRHTVRFCRDSDENSKRYITIGDSDTNWRIPQIVIRDLNVGWNGQAEYWDKGFKLTIDSVLPDAVDGIINNISWDEKSARRASTTELMNLAGYEPRMFTLSNLRSILNSVGWRTDHLPNLENTDFNTLVESGARFVRENGAHSPFLNKSSFLLSLAGDDPSKSAQIAASDGRGENQIPEFAGRTGYVNKFTDWVYFWHSGNLVKPKSIGYEISLARFLDEEYVMAVDEPITPHSIKDFAFSKNGLFMYVSRGNKLDQFTLSVAFKPESASFDYRYTLDNTNSEFKGIDFKPDGTKAYVKCRYLSNERVIEVSLSTPFDLETASINHFHNINSQDDGYGIKISNNGSYFFVLGDDLSRYQITTSFNLVSGVLHNGYVNVHPDYGTVTNFEVSSDGKKVFFLNTLKMIYEIALHGSYDMSSIYTGKSLRLINNADQSQFVAVRFDADGLTMNAMDSQYRKICRFNTSYHIDGDL